MGKSYTGYLRVSTTRQGQSGLGIEAQRAAIVSHIGKDGKLVCEFVEVESGKRDSRPELRRALDHARRTGTTLIVAKLDRLSRSAHFLLTVLNGGVDVEFADLPQVNGPQGKFLLTSLAAVAELEAGMISQRTKAALAACRARGVRLGNPEGAKHLINHIRVHGNGPAMAGKARAALNRAEAWRETLETLISEGLTDYGIAKVLTGRGETTVKGGRWSPTAVRRLRQRLDRNNAVMTHRQAA